jgi:hypothetical protein
VDEPADDKASDEPKTTSAAKDEVPAAKAPKRGLRARIGAGFRAALPTLVMILVTLVLVDIVCFAADLFPTRYRKGSKELGFYETRGIPGGFDGFADVPELANVPEVKKYHRNEEGFFTTRSMSDWTNHPTGRRIVAVGDSHTELPYAFEKTHMGVLETKLHEGGWPGAEVLGAGHGKWSPLQEMMLYDLRFRKLGVDVCLVNFYTGNDFYDLIRTDDRPHLVRAPDGGYAVAPPEWVAYYDPDTDPLWRQSRILYLGFLGLERIGVSNLLDKTAYAMKAADAFGKGMWDSVGYLNDLRLSQDPEVWYEAAYAAQLLNQALFFQHFPGSHEESLARARYVLATTKREMEKKGDKALFVLSPIPSRILAQPDLADPIYDRILARLPLTKEIVFEREREGYELLRTVAAETGWVFVDTLEALRGGEGMLYFPSDLHIAPAGSALVGAAQAKRVTEAWNARAAAAAPPTP